MKSARRLVARLHRNPYFRYLLEFRDLKRRLALGNLFAVIQAVSLVPVSLLFKQVIDVYVPAGDAMALWYVAAVGVSLWGVHVAATVASRYFTLSATKTVTERLRARLTMKLQQMSLRFHDHERAADLHSRVVMDTERVDVMANHLVVGILVSVLVALSVAVVLVWMNPGLAVLVGLAVPLYLLIRRAYAPLLKAGHKDFRSRMEQMSSTVSEVLHAIRLVKSFANEHHEQQRVEERIASVTHRGVNLFTQSAAFQTLLQAVGGICSILIFCVGGWMVMGGHLTVGEVVAFASLLGMFLTPVNTLISSTDVLFAGRAGLESIYALLDIHDTEESEHLPQIEVRGEVRFENVRFGYRPDQPVLNGIEFTVAPGEQVALVGGSGAGKTTLINLILAFYSPQAGRVLIDGHDVLSLNIRRLREQIGVVSQDNVLLSGTIRENIRYGRLEATDAEIEAAARLANAHDFIVATPDGYDSDIGDRGVRLSGGQKQRIAIARAVLRDPKILILDEATSALDSESEHLVQEALDRLRVSRTSFIIAHRLSTVQNADRILVLRDGRIVEQGRYEELLALRGEFYRFHRLQFERQRAGFVA